MTLHGKSIIAGVPGQAGGKTFHGINPATNQRLEPAFHEASDHEVNNALEASALAFTRYRETTGGERAALLERIATEIEAVGDELVQRATAETGLPAARVTGERARTCG